MWLFQVKRTDRDRHENDNDRTCITCKHRLTMYKHILYFSVRCINWPLYIILLYSTLSHMCLYYFGQISFRLKNRNHKFVVLAKKIHFHFNHLSFRPNIFSYINNTIRYITIVIQQQYKAYNITNYIFFHTIIILHLIASFVIDTIYSYYWSIINNLI